MTIKQKLILGIGIILATVALNIAFTSYKLNSVKELSTETATESVPFSMLASDAKFQSCQIQQFVTDGSLTNEDEAMKNAQDAHKKFVADIEKFEVMFKSENDTESLKKTDAMRAAADELLDTGKRMKEAYAKSDADGDRVMGELDNDALALAKIVDELKESQANEAITNSSSVMNDTSSMFATNLIFGLITLILGVAVGVILTQQITTSLTKVQSGLMSFFAFLNRESSEAKLIELDSKDEFGDMAREVNKNILITQKGIEEDRKLIDETIAVLGELESGDLCQRLDLSVSNPALMELKSVLNKMADNLENNIDNVLHILEEYAAYNYLNKIDSKGLKEHLLKLANGVNTLGDAITGMLVEDKSNGLTLDQGSSALLANVDKLNASSSEAAMSLEETAAALEEITGTIRNSTEIISRMSSLASNVTESAHDGEQLASQTTIAMDEIYEQVNKIDEAITVIDQIAFQTNILSLNAAVEAATAGDVGKGFAVVAGEVRNLASRSAEAAKEIKILVGNAKNKAGEGKSISDEMIKGYGQLGSNITQTINLIADIENASKEQLAGIEQINNSMASLDQQTQGNAHIAAQTHSIAVATDAIAKLVVSEANAKEFKGKNEVRAKAI